MEKKKRMEGTSGKENGKNRDCMCMDTVKAAVLQVPMCERAKAGLGTGAGDRLTSLNTKGTSDLRID